jgi:intracellular sulfur oxidation DsrE/DsrF family protein
MTHTPHAPRRGFLASAAAAFLGLGTVPSLARSMRGADTSGPPDESWLRGLNGKHKQFVDIGTLRDGRALVRVANFLDVYAESYGLSDQDISVVVGVHGSALGIAFNDSLWAKYELGKRFTANDPLTKAPATRNPLVHKEPGYDWSTDYSVTRLQERGVRLIACMRSIRGLSVELAGDGRGAAPAINAEILANLLPAVTPVPAMIVAINRAQEAGLTYVFAD